MFVPSCARRVWRPPGGQQEGEARGEQAAVEIPGLKNGSLGSLHNKLLLLFSSFILFIFYIETRNNRKSFGVNLVKYPSIHELQ